MLMWKIVGVSNVSVLYMCPRVNTCPVKKFTRHKPCPTYKTETFETPTIFQINIIYKNKIIKNK